MASVPEQTLAAVLDAVKKNTAATEQHITEVRDLAKRSGLASPYCKRPD